MAFNLNEIPKQAVEAAAEVFGCRPEDVLLSRAATEYAIAYGQQNNEARQQEQTVLPNSQQVAHEARLALVNSARI